LSATAFPKTVPAPKSAISYFEQDLDRLPKILESADVIVGFNNIGFDLPAIKPYYTGDITKLPQLDLLDIIKQAAGHRVSLGRGRQRNFGHQKKRPRPRCDYVLPKPGV
jgi:hypothetical protein